MNLGTTVASSLSTSSLNQPRNIQTVNDHATSSTTTISCRNERPKRHRRFQKRIRSSFGSSASSSSSLSKSTIPESESDPGLFLYEVTSQNCPCEHHQSARLRESKSPKNFISEDNENFIDSFIVNNFEASVAPMRGFLTLTESSSNGDSGINTNSNGSQRSSARGYYDKFETRSSRAFSLSSSSSSNSSNSASDTEVNPDPKLTENNFPGKPTGDKEVTKTTNSTTTVILEHYKGCEDHLNLKQQVGKQQQEQNWCWQDQPTTILENNKACQKNTKPYQISPENDPANNWTLIKVNSNQQVVQGSEQQMTSIQEEEYDSLFSSSLKTSHSSSHKELCTCLGGQLSDQALTENQPRGHRILTRMASYPKCHPDFDPHRFDLYGNRKSADFDRKSADFDRKSADFDRKSENGLEAVAGLRQLPTIPPTSYFWQQRTSQEQTNNTQRPRRSRSPASTTPTSDFHKRPSRNFSHNSFSAISTSPDMIRHALDFEVAGCGNHDEIPPCVRNVILQQMQKPTPNPTHTIKMMKKLSKNINVPDDPSDPTAFTQDPMYCNVPKYKSRSKRSRQVAKIVGTFSFLMTMGIIITVLCFLYWSDNFKPITMM